MKKFEFNLEKLLSYKVQMMESEMTTLAILNSELREVQDRLSELREEQETRNKDFMINITGKTTSVVFQIYRSYQELLNQKIKNCTKEINNLKIKIDHQIELIKNLKIETKSLETLKDSRFEEYKKEDSKISEMSIEEFFSSTSMISMS